MNRTPVGSMRITIEYFAQAREAAGFPRETLLVEPPCTAPQLLQQIARQRGGKLAAVLLEANGLILAVGERQSGFDDTVPLNDGDEILVIPPISGG